MSKNKTIEFKDYKHEFIPALFKKGRDIPIRDWKYSPAVHGYLAWVEFEDSEIYKFTSRHMMWLDDFMRVIDKIKSTKYGKNKKDNQK